MNLSLITILLSFLEGFALIISPCILPILPLILSGSLTGSKARPIGIITGFIFIFSILVLFSRSLVQYTHLDPTYLRTTAFIILVLLGIIMLSTYLTEKFTVLTNRLVSVGNSLQTANNPQSGFWGGFVFGCLVGIIWTPCAGPLLAAAIVQIAIQQTTLSSVIAIIAFAIGAGVPMFIIAWLGRSVMTQFNFFKSHSILCRKILGAIIIGSVFYLIYSEGMMNANAQTNNERTTSASTLINGLFLPYKAPEIQGIDAWINSSPLELSKLKGKVILIDFWTYSCINCIRTLPYLKSWYEKYHDKNFIIIGIHTPEFEFEKNLSNVKNAVQKFGIHYPVALDNRYTTWLNYKNRYWPAHYLINKNGDVVYQHFGEGEYDVTENNIRYLLGLGGQASEARAEKLSSSMTPEIYLGYARANRMMNLQAALKNTTMEYHYPDTLPQDSWALQGKWIIHSEHVVSASSSAAIKLHFHAKKVYAVMGAVNHPVKVKIRLNQKTIKEIEVTHQQLYTLVDSNQSEEGTLELIAESPDLEVYTFTFG
jgi:cytochrome c biogenesis protein CcdA/thiol-disulfide isomerase/thioredoxin